jgi:glycosyltransferase involved in cell wall biosynthesis
MLFPWGQAASRRVYGNARSLVHSGYDVIVAGGSAEPETVAELPCPGDSGRLYHVGLGILPKRVETQLEKARRMLFSSSLSLLDWLETQTSKPSHIILYGGYAAYLLRLLPWCRRNGVALIGDVVEWYKASELPGGRFGLHSLNVSLGLRHLFPRCDGVIAISSYLSNYYAGRGCRIVQVPPTVDTEQISPRVASDDGSHPLTLVYAGTAGKKDLLRNVIEGMMVADPSMSRVRLKIVGYSADEVRSNWLGGAAVPRSILPMGKVEQREVFAILREADFTVMLRPQERFTQAGFPTKFVESIACGTPVIANLTSDLDRYLADEQAGIVCRDHSAAAFSEALGKALRMRADEVTVMRVSARQLAESSFDCRRYSGQLDSFLESTRRA